MEKNFTSKEQAMRYLKQTRCILVTLWFFSMSVIGSQFNNETLAGLTGLLITFLLINFYYAEKKRVMSQIIKNAQATNKQIDIANSQAAAGILSAAVKENKPEESLTASKLIGCPDCGKEVSRRAISCPNCGCPITLQAEKLSHVPDIDKITNEQQSNLGIPKCPTCRSANVGKISLASKAGEVALVGVFAIGKVSKTFKCNSCGYQW